MWPQMAPQHPCAGRPAAPRRGAAGSSRLRSKLAVRVHAQHQEQRQAAHQVTQHEGGDAPGVLVLTELAPTRAPRVLRLGTGAESSSSSGGSSSYVRGGAGSGQNGRQGGNPAETGPLSQLKALFLPEGYPGSVTSDYL